ncbi:MAG: C-terminal binding protein [Alphaproteobacteria bacterium]
MPQTLHLLTPDAQYADDAVVERETAGPGVRWTIQRERRPERLDQDAIATADAVVVWHEMPIDHDFIRRLKACRIIVRAGVGFDHIDLEEAGRAGIPVANTPDYGTSEVADHAIALMLAFTRGIVSYHNALVHDVHAGFDCTVAPLVRRIRGRTFGVIGLGRIGTAAALRARGMGMRIVAYDPYVSRGTEIALGVERTESLEALLQQSDVVSIHCPLTAETRNMIDAAALGRMKRDAILVNTARGAIVDIPALIAALRDGTIAAAGIDVLPVEPPAREEAIGEAMRAFQGTDLAHRLILTPHAAWGSPESAHDARRLAVETAMLYLRQGILRNCVNAQWLRS